MKIQQQKKELKAKRLSAIPFNISYFPEDYWKQVPDQLLTSPLSLQQCTTTRIFHISFYSLGHILTEFILGRISLPSLFIDRTPTHSSNPHPNMGLWRFLHLYCSSQLMLLHQIPHTRNHTPDNRNRFLTVWRAEKSKPKVWVYLKFSW